MFNSMMSLPAIACLCYEPNSVTVTTNNHTSFRVKPNSYQTDYNVVYTTFPIEPVWNVSMVCRNICWRPAVKKWKFKMFCSFKLWQVSGQRLPPLNSCLHVMVIKCSNVPRRDFKASRDLIKIKFTAWRVKVPGWHEHELKTAAEWHSFQNLDLTL